MPKIKTKKSAAKRFKILASGKIKRRRANKRHLLTGKSRKQKNRLKKGAYVHSANVPNALKCLPNG